MYARAVCIDKTTSALRGDKRLCEKYRMLANQKSLTNINNATHNIVQLFSYLHGSVDNGHIEMHLLNECRRPRYLVGYEQLTVRDNCGLMVVKLR